MTTFNWIESAKKREASNATAYGYNDPKRIELGKRINASLEESAKRWKIICAICRIQNHAKRRGSRFTFKRKFVSAH